MLAALKLFVPKNCNCMSKSVLILILDNDYSETFNEVLEEVFKSLSPSSDGTVQFMDFIVAID